MMVAAAAPAFRPSSLSMLLLQYFESSPSSREEFRAAIDRLGYPWRLLMLLVKRRWTYRSGDGGHGRRSHSGSIGKNESD